MVRDLFEIASMFIVVAGAALLIGHPTATATVAQAVGGTFAGLLAQVELAPNTSGIGSQYGNVFAT